MRPTLIFDFDGTIADTFEMIIGIFHTLGKKHGFKVPDDLDTETLRGKTLKEVVFKTLHIPLLKLPMLWKEGRQIMKENITQIQLIDGMAELIKTLKKDGYTLGIVTSNSVENVNALLANHTLQLFDFIHSEQQLFQKSKILKHVLQERNLKPGHAIYIGDEVRDIEAARKVGIETIAVTWGLNNEEVLKKYEPKWMARKPEEIIKILAAHRE